MNGPLIVIDKIPTTSTPSMSPSLILPANILSVPSSVLGSSTHLTCLTFFSPLSSCTLNESAVHRNFPQQWRCHLDSLLHTLLAILVLCHMSALLTEQTLPNTNITNMMNHQFEVRLCECQISCILSLDSIVISFWIIMCSKYDDIELIWEYTFALIGFGSSYWWGRCCKVYWLS